MAFIVNKIDVLPRASKKRILSCMQKPENKAVNKFYDADGIQERINEAAKVRARLDAEIKQRYENLKHINFIG